MQLSVSAAVATSRYHDWPIAGGTLHHAERWASRLHEKDGEHGQAIMPMIHIGRAFQNGDGNGPSGSGPAGARGDGSGGVEDGGDNSEENGRVYSPPC